MRKMQRFVMYYLDEKKITREEFCSKVGVFEDTYESLMHINDNGNTWGPTWTYRIWDSLDIPEPNITVGLQW